MKAIFLFIFFLLVISCDKEAVDEPKLSACETKLKDYHICLLSQFYSATCVNMTEQRSKELIDFCQQKYITEDLKTKCQEKINNYQKTISEQKLNRCKKAGEDQT